LLFIYLSISHGALLSSLQTIDVLSLAEKDSKEFPILQDKIRAEKKWDEDKRWKYVMNTKGGKKFYKELGVIDHMADAEMAPELQDMLNKHPKYDDKNVFQVRPVSLQLPSLRFVAVVLCSIIPCASCVLISLALKEADKDCALLGQKGREDCSRGMECGFYSF
jgi:hypothetical protein